jgi:predicted transposase YbfD/YdcC
VKVDEKSNEITPIPQLLKALQISGCIVTTDAVSCLTDITKKIVERETNYVFGLKENQGHPYEDVQRLFADLEGSRYKGIKRLGLTTK